MFKGNLMASTSTQVCTKVVEEVVKIEEEYSDNLLWKLRENSEEEEIGKQCKQKYDKENVVRWKKLEF